MCGAFSEGCSLEMSMITLSGLLPLFMALLLTVIEECYGLN